MLRTGILRFLRAGRPRCCFVLVRHMGKGTCFREQIGLNVTRYWAEHSATSEHVTFTQDVCGAHFKTPPHRLVHVSGPGH